MRRRLQVQCTSSGPPLILRPNEIDVKRLILFKFHRYYRALWESDSFMNKPTVRPRSPKRHGSGMRKQSEAMNRVSRRAKNIPKALETRLGTHRGQQSYPVPRSRVRKSSSSCGAFQAVGANNGAMARMKV